MKRIVLLISAFIITGCSVFQKSGSAKSKEETPSVKYTVLKPDEVNTAQKKRAYDLGKRVLMTCNTSQFKPFTPEEATQTVIKNVNRDKISMTCHQVKRGFGTFNDMTLEQIYYDKKNRLTIYRYKCDYEKKYRIKEMRVIMNESNQVTSIVTKDWVDEFQ